jgi:hypothetical protein
MNRFMPGRQHAKPPRNEGASLPRFEKKIETHRAPGHFERMMTVTNPRQPAIFQGVRWSPPGGLSPTLGGALGGKGAQGSGKASW